MPPRKSQSAQIMPVNLKTLAKYLDLSPAAVSIVLNNTARAQAIPQQTRERIFAAAKKFNYRPSYFAQSLRARKTMTIAVIAPELSEGYFTSLMMGVEQALLQAGFLYFTVSHLCQEDLMKKYTDLFIGRSVDGFMLVNTVLKRKLPVPVVSISTENRVAGVTNVLVDHQFASNVALKHLYALGHRKIAFMKGQPESHDSDNRWQSILDCARDIGIIVRPELCMYLEKNLWSPELGYPVVRDLLIRTRDFTAIFCFNDIAAIGAVRAILDAGLSCPKDISVIGFDDISSAAYLNPSLTTVRQPLRQMGETAAQQLIQRIETPEELYESMIKFIPELIVRESTSHVKAQDQILDSTRSITTRARSKAG